MGLFNKKRATNPTEILDFEYLKPGEIYLDSACQTLRPKPVIDAMTDYFHGYNACGGRVKYEWGVKVDEKIRETKKRVLEYAGKRASEYAVAFTLNTTYGLNLTLGQLPRRFAKIITSDIEHNSVFLPTMTAAKRLGIPRIVLPRSADGALEFDAKDLTGGVVVALNSASNIDGRPLSNLRRLTDETHAAGGIVLVDAAQGMSCNPDLIRSSEFDALYFSGHKLYGPSLGIVIIKKSLLRSLDIHFVGGGMVDDVDEQGYALASGPDDLANRLEAGLQNFAGIVGLGAGLDWLKRYKPEGRDRSVQQNRLSKLLFERLSAIPALKLLNPGPSPIASFYSDKIDSHRLAIFLSARNIMVRSGYFCCHYYLKNLKKYPPLVRASLGLHNTEQQVETFAAELSRILSNA